MEGALILPFAVVKIRNSQSQEVTNLYSNFFISPLGSIKE